MRLEVNVTKNRTYKLGVTALLLSALLTAASQVFYASRVQNAHPFLFTGISFFLTACYFSFFARSQKETYRWKSSWQSLLKLNLSSVLAFMGFYFALKFIEPAIVSSLEMGLGPLFVIFLALMQREVIAKAQWGIAFGTLSACLLLVISVFNGVSGVQTNLDSSAILGLIASVACGLGAVLCTNYSNRLSGMGWTSSMILTHRLYGIIILSFIFTYNILFDYIFENILWILIVTVAGVLLPMYLLQKGIQYCETFLVMMSLCFVPVFTFLFQLFDPRISWSTTTLMGVVLLFILGVFSINIGEKQS
ncbi:DMT family transporter [Lysinibacillus yapensis]|uniref:DMT family transporter n=1 Tax=Ureibacillus yapensis TaxID=2304605 RepID=UPI001314AEC3|nr:DMT family transporter [Lysinibacillus yapensis]